MLHVAAASTDQVDPGHSREDSPGARGGKSQSSEREARRKEVERIDKVFLEQIIEEAGKRVGAALRARGSPEGDEEALAWTLMASAWEELDRSGVVSGPASLGPEGREGCDASAYIDAFTS